MRTALRYAAVGVGGLLAIATVWAVYFFVVHYRYNGLVEQVEFPSSGGVTLGGWLGTPDAPGPHPYVVLLHGAGPAICDGPPATIWANAFLRSGVGVLCYDKRGNGRSGGTFVRNRYTDFIEDGIAAVRYLKSQPDRVAAIGLLGSSESGWFTPEIADRIRAVAFIINRAGPPLPWIETNLWELENDLAGGGLSGEALSEAVRVRELVWRLIVDIDADSTLADGARWRSVGDELAAFEERFGRDPAWRAIYGDDGYLQQLPSYAPEWVHAEAQFIGYDPQPFIERLRIPMLYIFAEQDKIVPVPPSVAYLESLQQQGRSEIEVRVLTGLGHPMLPLATLWAGGAPGFIDVIGPWTASKSH